MDFNFGDLGALTQYFQPSEEDKKKAQNAALLAAGFGMLANNRGNYGALSPALGAGGLGGMQAYNATLNEAPKERAQALSQAMTFQKLKKDMSAQDMFANMYGPSAPAGGNVNMATAPGTMNDAGPGMTLPNPAPTAKTAAGPTLQQIGMLMGANPELGKSALELWKAQNPGIQVHNGYAYDPRTTQPGFLPQLNVTPNGQAVQTAIGADGQPTISAPRGSMDTARGFAEVTADQGQPVTLNMKIGNENREVKVSPKEAREYFNTGAIPARLGGAPVAAPQAEAPAAPSPTAGGKLNLVAPDDATAQKWMKQFETQGIPANITVKQRPAPVAEPAPMPTPAPSAPGNPLGKPLLGVGPSGAEAAASAARAEAQKAEAAVVGKTFGETFENVQKSGFNSQAKLNRFNRIEQLLSGIDTGKLTPLASSAAQTANSLGFKVDPKWNNIQAAEALANEMALELRNPAGGAGMPGAMSDADRNFLAAMAPGVEKTPEGRKLIIDSGRQLAKRDQEVAQLARDYRKTHGQIDEGFYDHLAKYSAENPLFASKDAGGHATLSASEQKELDQLRKRFKR